MNGGTVDGTYERDEPTGSLMLRLSVTLPKGVSVIQGDKPTEDEIQYSVDALLPADFVKRSHVSIQTPLGPINARFKRIRGLGESD